MSYSRTSFNTIIKADGLLKPFVPNGPFIRKPKGFEMFSGCKERKMNEKYGDPILFTLSRI